MAEKAAGNQAKTVVVPRGLEGFFRERLERRYEGHENVRVIIDRRDRHVSWSLPDMPFASS